MKAVDLYAVSFWWCVAVALLVMIPLSGERARKWAFAALNLAFLALHTGPGGGRALIGVYLAVVVAWAVLQGVAIPGRSGALIALLGGTLVLALFIAHKLPRATLG